MKERFIKLHSLNEASLDERRDRHTAATGKQTMAGRRRSEMWWNHSSIWTFLSSVMTFIKLCFAEVFFFFLLRQQSKTLNYSFCLQLVLIK